MDWVFLEMRACRGMYRGFVPFSWLHSTPHPSGDGYLCLSHPLAAVHTCAAVLLWTRVLISPGETPQRGIAGPDGNCTLNVLKTCRLVLPKRPQRLTVPGDP